MPVAIFYSKMRRYIFCILLDYVNKGKWGVLSELFARPIILPKQFWHELYSVVFCASLYINNMFFSSKQNLIFFFQWYSSAAWSRMPGQRQGKTLFLLEKTRLLPKRKGSSQIHENKLQKVMQLLRWGLNKKKRTLKHLYSFFSLVNWWFVSNSFKHFISISNHLMLKFIEKSRYSVCRKQDIV